MKIKKYFNLINLIFCLSISIIFLLLFLDVITHANAILLYIIVFLIVIYTQISKNLTKIEVLDYTGYGIIKLSAKKGVVFANKYALNALGYKFNDLRKSYFHELIENNYNNNLNQNSKKIYFSKDKRLSNNIFKHYENKYQCSVFIDTDYFIKKNGEFFPVEYIVIPIISKNKVSNVVITFRDTTERRIMQYKLLKMTEELRSSNKELESFSYSVSHDLRAPLRHISGYINFLNENESIKTDVDTKRYIDIIMKSTKKMGDLIDDLLIFSRVSRSELQKSKVDLNETVEELKDELCRFKTEGNEINFVIEQLPHVMADKKMIRLVLMNLMSNAIKFTKYKDNPKISISSELSEKEVIIKIDDNGVGFEQKYVDKIFGVFQRLHKESEFEGTGIGLANVFRIISRHNGRVWAIGRPNKGATFFISLPREEV